MRCLWLLLVFFAWNPRAQTDVSNSAVTLLLANHTTRSVLLPQIVEVRPGQPPARTTLAQTFRGAKGEDRNPLLATLDPWKMDLLYLEGQYLRQFNLLNTSTKSSSTASRLDEANGIHFITYAANSAWGLRSSSGDTSPILFQIPLNDHPSSGAMVDWLFIDLSSYSVSGGPIFAVAADPISLYMLLGKSTGTTMEQWLVKVSYLDQGPVMDLEVQVPVPSHSIIWDSTNRGLYALAETSAPDEVSIGMLHIWGSVCQWVNLTTIKYSGTLNGDSCAPFFFDGAIYFCSRKGDFIIMYVWNTFSKILSQTMIQSPDIVLTHVQPNALQPFEPHCVELDESDQEVHFTSSYVLVTNELDMKLVHANTSQEIPIPGYSINEMTVTVQLPKRGPMQGSDYRLMINYVSGNAYSHWAATICYTYFSERAIDAADTLLFIDDRTEDASVLQPSILKLNQTGPSRASVLARNFPWNEEFTPSLVTLGSRGCTLYAVSASSSTSTWTIRALSLKTFHDMQLMEFNASDVTSLIYAQDSLYGLYESVTGQLGVFVFDMQPEAKASASAHLYTMPFSHGLDLIAGDSGQLWVQGYNNATGIAEYYITSLTMATWEQGWGSGFGVETYGPYSTPYVGLVYDPKDHILYGFTQEPQHLYLGNVDEVVGYPARYNVTIPYHEFHACFYSDTSNRVYITTRQASSGQYRTYAWNPANPMQFIRVASDTPGLMGPITMGLLQGPSPTFLPVLKNRTLTFSSDSYIIPTPSMMVIFISQSFDGMDSAFVSYEALAWNFSLNDPTKPSITTPIVVPQSQVTPFKIWVSWVGRSLQYAVPLAGVHFVSSSTPTQSETFDTTITSTPSLPSTMSLSMENATHTRVEPPSSSSTPTFSSSLSEGPSPTQTPDFTLSSTWPTPSPTPSPLATSMTLPFSMSTTPTSTHTLTKPLTQSESRDRTGTTSPSPSPSSGSTHTLGVSLRLTLHYTLSGTVESSTTNTPIWRGSTSTSFTLTPTVQGTLTGTAGHTLALTSMVTGSGTRGLTLTPTHAMTDTTSQAESPTMALNLTESGIPITATPLATTTHTRIPAPTSTPDSSHTLSFDNTITHPSTISRTSMLSWTSTGNSSGTAILGTPTRYSTTPTHVLCTETTLATPTLTPFTPTFIPLTLTENSNLTESMVEDTPTHIPFTATYDTLTTTPPMTGTSTLMEPLPFIPPMTITLTPDRVGWVTSGYYDTDLVDVKLTTGHAAIPYFEWNWDTFRNFTEVSGLDYYNFSDMFLFHGSVDDFPTDMPLEHRGLLEEGEVNTSDILDNLFLYSNSTNSSVCNSGSPLAIAVNGNAYANGYAHPYSWEVNIPGTSSTNFPPNWAQYVPAPNREVGNGDRNLSFQVQPLATWLWACYRVRGSEEFQVIPGFPIPLTPPQGPTIDPSALPQKFEILPNQSGLFQLQKFQYPVDKLPIHFTVGPNCTSGEPLPQIIAKVDRDVYDVNASIPRADGQMLLCYFNGVEWRVVDGSNPITVKFDPLAGVGEEVSDSIPTWALLLLSIAVACCLWCCLVAVYIVRRRIDINESKKYSKKGKMPVRKNQAWANDTESSSRGSSRRSVRTGSRANSIIPNVRRDGKGKIQYLYNEKSECTDGMLTSRSNNSGFSNQFVPEFQVTAPAVPVLTSEPRPTRPSITSGTLTNGSVSGAGLDPPPGKEMEQERKETQQNGPEEGKRASSSVEEVTLKRGNGMVLVQGKDGQPLVDPLSGCQFHRPRRRTLAQLRNLAPLLNMEGELILDIHDNPILVDSQYMQNWGRIASPRGKDSNRQTNAIRGMNSKYVHGPSGKPLKSAKGFKIALSGALAFAAITEVESSDDSCEEWEALIPEPVVDDHGNVRYDNEGDVAMRHRTCICKPHYLLGPDGEPLWDRRRRRIKWQRAQMMAEIDPNDSDEYEVFPIINPTTGLVQLDEDHNPILVAGPVRRQLLLAPNGKPYLQKDGKPLTRKKALLLASAMQILAWGKGGDEDMENTERVVPLLDAMGAIQYDMHTRPVLMMVKAPYHPLKDADGNVLYDRQGRKLTQRRAIKLAKRQYGGLHEEPFEPVVELDDDGKVKRDSCGVPRFRKGRPLPVEYLKDANGDVVVDRYGKPLSTSRARNLAGVRDSDSDEYEIEVMMSPDSFSSEKWVPLRDMTRSPMLRKGVAKPKVFAMEVPGVPVTDHNGKPITCVRACHLARLRTYNKWNRFLELLKYHAKPSLNILDGVESNMAGDPLIILEEIRPPPFVVDADGHPVVQCDGDILTMSMAWRRLLEEHDELRFNVPVGLTYNQNVEAWNIEVARDPTYKKPIYDADGNPVLFREEKSTSTPSTPGNIMSTSMSVQQGDLSNISLERTSLDMSTRVEASLNGSSPYKVPPELDSSRPSKRQAPRFFTYPDGSRVTTCHGQAITQAQARKILMEDESRRFVAVPVPDCNGRPCCDPLGNAKLQIIPRIVGLNLQAFLNDPFGKVIVDSLGRPLTKKGARDLYIAQGGIPCGLGWEGRHVDLVLDEHGQAVYGPDGDPLLVWGPIQSSYVLGPLGTAVADGKGRPITVERGLRMLGIEDDDNEALDCQVVPVCTAEGRCLRDANGDPILRAVPRPPVDYLVDHSGKHVLDARGQLITTQRAVRMLQRKTIQPPQYDFIVPIDNNLRPCLTKTGHPIIKEVLVTPMGEVVLGDDGRPMTRRRAEKMKKAADDDESEDDLLGGHEVEVLFQNPTTIARDLDGQPLMRVGRFNKAMLVCPDGSTTVDNKGKPITLRRAKRMAGIDSSDDSDYEVAPMVYDDGRIAYDENGNPVVTRVGPPLHRYLVDQDGKPVTGPTSQPILKNHARKYLRSQLELEPEEWGLVPIPTPAGFGSGQCGPAMHKRARWSSFVLHPNLNKEAMVDVCGLPISMARGRLMYQFQTGRTPPKEATMMPVRSKKGKEILYRPDGTPWLQVAPPDWIHSSSRAGSNTTTPKDSIGNSSYDFRRLADAVSILNKPAVDSEPVPVLSGNGEAAHDEQGNALMKHGKKTQSPYLLGDDGRPILDGRSRPITMSAAYDLARKSAAASPTSGGNEAIDVQPKRDDKGLVVVNALGHPELVVEPRATPLKPLEDGNGSPITDEAGRVMTATRAVRNLGPKPKPSPYELEALLDHKGNVICDVSGKPRLNKVACFDPMLYDSLLVCGTFPLNRADGRPITHAQALTMATAALESSESDNHEITIQEERERIVYDTRTNVPLIKRGRRKRKRYVQWKPFLEGAQETDTGIWEMFDMVATNINIQNSQDGMGSGMATRQSLEVRRGSLLRKSGNGLTMGKFGQETTQVQFPWVGFDEEDDVESSIDDRVVDFQGNHISQLRARKMVYAADSEGSTEHEMGPIQGPRGKGVCNRQGNPLLRKKRAKKAYVLDSKGQPVVEKSTGKKLTVKRARKIVRMREGWTSRQPLPVPVVNGHGMVVYDRNGCPLLRPGEFLSQSYALDPDGVPVIDGQGRAVTMQQAQRSMGVPSDDSDEYEATVVVDTIGRVMKDKAGMPLLMRGSLRPKEYLRDSNGELIMGEDAQPLSIMRAARLLAYQTPTGSYLRRNNFSPKYAAVPLLCHDPIRDHIWPVYDPLGNPILERLPMSTWQVQYHYAQQYVFLPSSGLALLDIDGTLLSQTKAMAMAHARRGAADWEWGMGRGWTSALDVQPTKTFNELAPLLYTPNGRVVLDATGAEITMQRALAMVGVVTDDERLQWHVQVRMDGDQVVEKDEHNNPLLQAVQTKTGKYPPNSCSFIGLWNASPGLPVSD